MLGRKQAITHEEFLAALARIEQIVPREVYQHRKAAAVAHVRAVTAGKRAAFGWSGGKDSIALQAVCTAAGIEACVFGMSDLEYPAFLRWVTDHMPPALEVINNRWDLDWLAKRADEMLFPQTSTIAAKWFRGIQHYAQETYFRRHNLDLLILGRRKADGNFCGDGYCYTAKGVTRFSPLAEWTHEEVLASLVYEGWANKLPPFYGWPRGFRCGTHAWPARQWCSSIAHGWAEVYSIDRGIVIEAARKIDSAKRFLDSKGAI